jgi:flagellar basal body-associated protein FliL
MVVGMAEDQQKEEAKQKLRFFKNGKDKGQPGEQAVATEDSAPPAEETAADPKAGEVEVVPAGDPSADRKAPDQKSARPEAKAGEPKPKPAEPEAKAGEPGEPAEGPGAAGDEAATATRDAQAPGPAPDAGSRPRRRERVKAQEPETVTGESLTSHLLPSLTLGFRTLVILAIIVADAFAAYVLTTKVLAPKLIETKVVDLREEISQLPPDGGVLPAAKPKETKGIETVGNMFQIKDIVVNPSGTNGTRYLCTTVALEIKDPLVEEEATAREAQVRDLLIEILGRRTVAELSSLDTRDDIREEIRASVNSLLASGGVDGVYFSNFVLQ